MIPEGTFVNVVYQCLLLNDLERIARECEADLLAFGHTHLPYVKDVLGVRFVNDGSVGKPKDGDVRACYALIEIGDGIDITIRHVPYDVAAAAAAVRESGLPLQFADMLETATG